MASQQVQAQALGDPSRFKIFTHLKAAEAPVAIAELVDLLGFNHNAIRQHLAKLVDADLIIEMTEQRTTRGRPRRLYEARDDALDAFVGEIGSYEWLSGRLLEMHESGESAYEVGRRAGIAGAASATPTGGSFARLTASLRRGGFDPAPDPDGAGLTLGRCPFADAAAKSPAVVCELHRGLIDGHLGVAAAPATDGAGDSAVLTVADPHAGGCHVSVPIHLGRTGTARQ